MMSKIVVKQESDFPVSLLFKNRLFSEADEVKQSTDLQGLLTANTALLMLTHYYPKRMLATVALWHLRRASRTKKHFYSKLIQGK